MVQTMIDNEVAYDAEGDVYFHVRSDPGYGRLSGRDVESLRVGARIEVDERKRDGLDFALWKAQKPGEPAWDSPWGKGRPGWHIECSAMAAKYLGENIDIHGGGQDLIFPHHENEIAQTEACTGNPPMARFWMHNGMVELGDEKMSKSLGNIVTLGEALERHSSDALRLFFLNSHYRSPLIYREDIVEAQERAAERLRRAATVENDGNLDSPRPCPLSRRIHRSHGRRPQHPTRPRSPLRHEPRHQPRPRGGTGHLGCPIRTQGIDRSPWPHPRRTQYRRERRRQ